VFLHSITEAGDRGPVGEFAAGAENVFVLIGAEKVGTIFIPKSDVVKNCAWNGIAGNIDDSGMEGEKPTGHRNGPDEIGRLGHFHMGGRGWKIQRAHTERNSA